MTTISYEDLSSEIFRMGHAAKINKAPIIIGISGPPASGKTTLATLLKDDLIASDNTIKANVLPLDNFIYPNFYLKKHDLMEKKGFPESFNIKAMFEFINDLQCSNKEFYYAPLYSHVIKDIHPEMKYTLPTSDVYIIEGVALFYELSQREANVSLDKYLALSVYLDIPESLIRERVSHRFISAFSKAKALSEVPEYFKPLISFSEEEIQQYELALWENVNKPLRDKFIDSTKSRATYCLANVPSIN